MAPVPERVKAPAAYKEEMATRIGFAAALRYGDWVIVSGVTGRNPDGTVIQDAEGQYRAAFEEIGQTLQAAGASWASVIDMSTFHQGGTPEERALFSQVRRDYVSEPYPAWTAVTVAALNSPDVLVEIKVIAIASESR